MIMNIPLKNEKTTLQAVTFFFFSYSYLYPLQQLLGRTFVENEKALYRIGSDDLSLFLLLIGRLKSVTL